MPAQLQALILPIGFLVIFYVFAIRPQRKKEKQIKEMRSNLRVGDSIVTIGGINGKILKVKDDHITLEVGSDKTKIEMMKWSVGSVINQEPVNTSK